MGLVVGFVGLVVPLSQLLPVVLSVSERGPSWNVPLGQAVRTLASSTPSSNFYFRKSSECSQSNGWDPWGHRDSGSHLGTTGKYTQWGCIVRLPVGIWTEEFKEGR